MPLASSAPSHLIRATVVDVEGRTGLGSPDVQMLVRPKRAPADSEPLRISFSYATDKRLAEMAAKLLPGAVAGVVYVTVLGDDGTAINLGRALMTF